MIFGWVKETDTGKLNLGFGPSKWLTEMVIGYRARMAIVNWRGWLIVKMPMN